MTAEGLPPSLRRLWGEDTAARPGQRPSLDVKRIARAAIELADDGGLPAVSMSRVASALGVTTMALYRYVESKAELLELMLEVAVGEPAPSAEDLDWRAALRAWAHELARIHRRHPWTVQVPVSGPPRGPYQLAWAEQGMAALEGTNLDGQERLGVVMLLLVYVRGDAALEQQLAGGSQGADDGSDDAFVATLRKLDAERFPNLQRLLDEPANGREAPPDVGTTATDFGLDRILDGVELLVRRRRRGGGGR